VQTGPILQCSRAARFSLASMHIWGFPRHGVKVNKPRRLVLNRETAAETMQFGAVRSKPLRPAV
jgi:hypothetical protein